MSSKNLSKDVLDVVKKKTGKTVTEKDIKKLAGTVTPKTIQSEQQLRQLIHNVARMVNAQVSESTVKEIVNAVKKSGVNPANMEELMKMMLGKK
ncbi:MAG TPA: stage VI sporulation protein F [Bacilli bacterium]